ncbi:MAG: hypothetical protein ACKOD4_02190, partial [Candidatus Limnocylindrus sp.]
GAELGDGEAGRWAQAAMDFASSVCRTSAPACISCPLNSICASAGRVAAREKKRRSAPVRFGSTARWLRGRLLDELRDAGQGGVIIRGARGEHPAAAVTATIRQLCDEGLAERVATATYRLPRRK